MKGIRLGNTSESRARRPKLPIIPAVWLLAGIVLACSCICLAANEPSAEAKPQAGAAAGLYLKVQLNSPVKLSKLKPGDIVEGKLSRDVYSADRELFTAGSVVRLPVDHLEKRRRERNDHWPWVVNAFTPRHEPYPVFKTAMVSGGKGENTLPVSLQVALISVSWMHEVHAKMKKNPLGQSAAESGPVAGQSGGQYTSAKIAAPVMVLEAFVPAGSPEFTPSGAAVTAPDMATLETLAAGTPCKILLLGEVSASKSKPGDVLQARLLEPVLINSRVVLPAGTLFDGRVVKRTPPRWGSRAGSLYFTFTGLTLPGGNRVPIDASLSGADLDRRSHTKIDSEGQLHGEHPGKAWMAINLGVTAGIAKEADDTFQLIFEAIVSTATDASTAGTARIISTCVSGVFIVTRHGRDVVIPRFTEMNIVLDRPLTITENPKPDMSTASPTSN